MIEDGARFISYICPACHETVVVRESVFTLSASERKLACPCGKSHLTAQLDEQVFHLTVPCLFCGGEHRMHVPAKQFIQESLIAYQCAASGFDCCYSGEEGKVFRGIESMEEIVTHLEQNTEERDFYNEIVMHEILSEIRDIAMRGDIGCQCGCREFELKILFSAVELKCKDCAGILHIPAATTEHVTDLCCKSSLTIHKKDRGDQSG